MVGGTAVPRIIALDIHKRETQACIMNEKGKVLEEARFPTRRDAYKKALAKHRGDAIIETTAMYRPVARWLTELGFEVHLANTYQIPKKKVKTDKKDARHLGDLFRANLLPEAYLPPEETQRLRDMTRQRQYLGRERRSLKAKIKLHLLKHGHFVDKNPVETIGGRMMLRKLAIPEIMSCIALLEVVDKEKLAYEAKIEKEAEALPNAKLLMTIPGVGAYTALFILAELGDVTRFRHKDALSSFAGLSVTESQSGDTQKRGNITKTGNPFLRWMLVEAARNHLIHCPESALSKRHKRIAKKRGEKKAMVATARVLLTVMYAMIMKGEAFQVNPSKPGLAAAP